VRHFSIGAVGAIAFAPDSRQLVTASADKIQVWDSFTGRELKRWPIAERFDVVTHSRPAATVLAVSPDGKTLASGHDDGTILLWPIPALPKPEPLAAVELEKLWAGLAAEDAQRAWNDLARLSDSPGEALALVRERLTPLAAPPDSNVKRLIAELAAPEFARREAATRALRRHADLLAEPLKAALAASRSPEQRARLRQLLEAPLSLCDPERTRRWRVVALLEQIGTPEARSLLEQIAQGPALTPEADAARGALHRMKQK
jgi:hypothetical protein